MRFPIEDIPQQNPYLTGIKQGNDLYTQILKSMFAKEAMKNQQAMSEENLKSTRIKNQYLPNELALGLEGQMSANDYSTMRNQYYPQDQQSQLDLRKAQTEKMSGPGSSAGQLFQDYQKIVAQYGKDSPQAQQFKQMMAAQSDSQGIRNNYYQALTESMPTRILPQFNRQQALNQLMSQGYTVDQAAKIMTSAGIDAGIQPNNPEMANQQNEQSESYLMRRYLPTSAQNSAYAAQTARPFAEGLMQGFPKVTEYLQPDSPVHVTRQQLESIVKGKTPTGLEDLAIFNNNLTAYKSKVADILKTPAYKDARDEINKMFDIRTWYSRPEYSQKVLSDLIYRVNEAEQGNLEGLSAVKKNLSKPIGLTVNPNQLADGAQNNPGIAKAAGIQSPQQKLYLAPDGNTYTREQLEKIARGEK